MKGIIRKYHADPTPEDLRDCADKSGCTELISDPDFWSNRFPIWSICGPYVRNNLKKDDIIFFLPNKKSLARLKLVEPICTGVLYVSEIIYNSDQLRKKVDEGYYKKYIIDLRNHLREDAKRTIRTKEIRNKNIVIGDNEKSRWLGENYKELKPLIEPLDKKLYCKICSNRIVEYLREDITRKIYEGIIGI